MDGLPGDAVEDGKKLGPLDKVDIRPGETPDKNRKCLECWLPLYPSEGLNQLCPWCYCPAPDVIEEALKQGG